MGYINMLFTDFVFMLEIEHFYISKI